jgi:hypothetical protein
MKMTNFEKVECYLNGLNLPYSLIKAWKRDETYSFLFLIHAKHYIYWHYYLYERLRDGYEAFLQVLPDKLGGNYIVLKVTGFKFYRDWEPLN